MKTVILKNGTEESAPLVAAAMLHLESLADDDPIALYELVMLARDRNHRLFGNTNEKLTARNLLEPDGTLHNSLRNIVLSAIEGDGFDMVLRSPVASP